MNAQRCHTRSKTRRRLKSRLCVVSLVILFVSADSFAPSSFSAPHNHNQRRTSSSACSRTKHTQLSVSTAIPPPLRGGARWFSSSSTATAPSVPPPDTKKTNQQQQKLSYEQAKRNWANKYCTLDGLRQSFGKNQNKVWGDLDAATTRKLYKSLMPVVLMELYETGLGDPQEMALLAYQARQSAKLYARERSVIPARLFANVFDGLRQWRKYGTFEPSGMTYQQVWEKYAEQVDCDENDKTNQICKTILERSCVSNEMIDKMVLNNNKQPNKVMRQNLEQVNTQLEHDVRQLLAADLHNKEVMTFRALREVVKLKRRINRIKENLH